MAENKTKNFGAELRQSRGRKSIDAMASDLGVNKNTLGGYERGDRFPDVDFLAKFAALTGCGFRRLLELRMENSELDTTREALGELRLRPAAAHGEGADFVLIPRYDIEASAGPGALIDKEHVLDYLAFQESWVRRELHADPAKLVLITARGDSMEPTIRPGDLLLIDTGINDFMDDAIYVLAYEDGLQVKRIQRFLTGAVAVRSDNERVYHEETLAPNEAARIRIAGRVRWIARLI